MCCKCYLCFPHMPHKFQRSCHLWPPSWRLRRPETHPVLDFTKNFPLKGIANLISGEYFSINVPRKKIDKNKEPWSSSALTWLKFVLFLRAVSTASPQGHLLTPAGGAVQPLTPAKFFIRYFFANQISTYKLGSNFYYLQPLRPNKTIFSKILLQTKPDSGHNIIQYNSEWTPQTANLSLQ